MKDHSHRIWKTVLARPTSLLAPLVLSVASQPLHGQDSPCDSTGDHTPWIFPDGRELTVATTEVVWAGHFWNGFIALNWPQSYEIGAQPGEPDPSTSICDPVVQQPVFLQWAQKSQLLPSDLTDPDFQYPAWDELGDPEFALEYKGLPLIGSVGKADTAALAGEFQEAFSQRPLYDQNGNFVLFQIFANKSELEYMAQTGYYDSEAQYQAFASTTPTFQFMPATGDPSEFDPPVFLEDWARQGAIELKTSWKQLTEEEILSNRFLMQDVYFGENREDAAEPCGPVTVGLVGMHILQLTENTRETWAWATFQQVDNLEAGPDHPTGAASFNPGPDGSCPPPYVKGYTCDTPRAECVDPDPLGTECPPAAPTLDSPLVCDTYPDRVVNVSQIPEMAPASYITLLNEEYQSQLPAPWRYYELVGTLQPENDGPCCVAPNNVPVNTCFMTNITMETYTQYRGDFAKVGCNASTQIKGMSCVDCHATAGPQGGPTTEYPTLGGSTQPYPEPPYQMFSFMFSNASSSCPADLNHDQIVDGTDLAILLGAWGSSDRHIKLDDDIVVDATDLSILLANWGGCPTPAGSGRTGNIEDDPLGPNGAAFATFMQRVSR